MKPIIIGTAGHVDHGKTTLIKNLTGTDTDRLKEEKARQLTIDLGYAFLNENIAFIDVPGHEKFIKNMVAGAATINYALLVIAADDGIMPQTIEHFEILRLLGIERGIIVLTKCDLIDSSQLEIRKNEVRHYFQNSFLSGCEIFEISKNNVIQISSLKKYLLALPENTINNTGKDVFRMPIDRVFSLKGFGTIITGTVISGELGTGDKDLTIYPENFSVTVRSLQTQNKAVSQISAARRCSMNLQSTDRQDLHRGQFVTDNKVFITTKILTCSFSKLTDIEAVKYGETVKFHINTAEYNAKIRIIGYDKIIDSDQHIVQFDFQQPVSVGFHDRYIIRKLSPRTTIGGGAVLDIGPPKIRKSNRSLLPNYQSLTKPDIAQNILTFLDIYLILSQKNLIYKLSKPLTKIQPVFQKLEKDNKIVLSDNYLCSNIHFNDLKHRVTNKIESNPLFKGITRSEILSMLNSNTAISSELLDIFCREKILVQKDDLFLLNKNEAFRETHNTRLVKRFLFKQGFKLLNYKKLQDKTGIEEGEFQNLINYLKIHQKIVALPNGYLIHIEQLKQAEHIFYKFLIKNKQATVSELKELLQTSRRYILPILSYFDKYLLKRAGDHRYLQKEKAGHHNLPSEL